MDVDLSLSLVLNQIVLYNLSLIYIVKYATYQTSNKQTGWTGYHMVKETLLVQIISSNIESLAGV